MEEEKGKRILKRKRNAKGKDVERDGNRELKKTFPDAQVRWEYRSTRINISPLSQLVEDKKAKSNTQVITSIVKHMLQETQL